jgi:hypothetical protein
MRGANQRFPNAKCQKFASLPAAEQFIASVAPSGPIPSFSTDVSSSTDVKGKKRAFGPEIRYIVYSDGACSGNRKVGSVAELEFGGGRTIRGKLLNMHHSCFSFSSSRDLSEKCLGEQTNNRAELIVGLVLFLRASANW